MSQPSPDTRPKAGRPTFPDGYGVPENDEGLLPWRHVEERMRSAKNYWIATASPEGKPAATPVWGVWIKGRLYFDGAPATRRGRNIARNPQVAVHLESGDEVVILEGKCSILGGAPERKLAELLSREYSAKYGALGYAPGPDNWDGGGLFVFTPASALAWTQFPQDATRWTM